MFCAMIATSPNYFATSTVGDIAAKLNAIFYKIVKISLLALMHNKNNNTMIPEGISCNEMNRPNKSSETIRSSLVQLLWLLWLCVAVASCDFGCGAADVKLLLLLLLLLRWIILLLVVLLFGELFAVGGAAASTLAAFVLPCPVASDKSRRSYC